MLDKYQELCPHMCRQYFLIFWQIRLASQDSDERCGTSQKMHICTTRSGCGPASNRMVSVLGCPDPAVHEIAYQYGKNVGIAFQLIDDVLDFTSCSDQMGKPTSADLKLGLATGPVLFACQQFPEMNAMIMRRFSLPGDVDRARQYVLQSDGVQQTTYLAQRYCHEAIREISKLRPSPEREALIQLSEIVLTRDK
uniref:Decaprenyl diphosphate synthase subunit 1 n=1 Tax=Sus scrofa TaxID=9823 RepID=A0A4X1TZ33_PIG